MSDPTDFPRPECDRMVVVAPFSQHIGDFLDWLEEQGRYIAYRDDDDDRLYIHMEPKTQLLARFYEVDLDKVEDERRQLLDALQEKS